MKYIIEKTKGAFYAGMDKIAAKGLKLRRYVSLDSVRKMAKALRLSPSSVVFKGVSKGEQNKILSVDKQTANKKSKKAKKKAKASRRRG